MRERMVGIEYACGPRFNLHGSMGIDCSVDFLPVCQTHESGGQIHICWYFRWGCMVRYSVIGCSWNNAVKNCLDLHQVQKCPNLIMLIVFHWLTSVNALATPLEAFFNISLPTHTQHTLTHRHERIVSPCTCTRGKSGKWMNWRVLISHVDHSGEWEEFGRKV